MCVFRNKVKSRVIVNIFGTETLIALLYGLSSIYNKLLENCCHIQWHIAASVPVIHLSSNL